tara:strand:+ start:115 stop:432 length:318 start_codon:yes stop_codon:yes gene_type:complete
MDLPTVEQELNYYLSLTPIRDKEYAIKFYFKNQLVKHIPMFYVVGMLQDSFAKDTTSVTKDQALKQKNIHFVRDKDNKIKAFFYKMPVKQKKSPTEIFYDKFNSK